MFDKFNIARKGKTVAGGVKVGDTGNDHQFLFAGGNELLEHLLGGTSSRFPQKSILVHQRQRGLVEF